MFPELILHKYSVGGYTPSGGELEFPVDSLCANLGVGIVSLLCSSPSATGLSVLVSANTEPSILQIGCLPCNSETTGSDGLGCTGSPYVALLRPQMMNSSVKMWTLCWLMQVDCQTRLTINRADFFLLVACFVRGSTYHEGLRITAGELERGMIFHCILELLLGIPLNHRYKSIFPEVH